MADIVTYGSDDAATDKAPAGQQERISALLMTVGERVRGARKGLGLSRRELSENSGVSQRYIAQLETGQGNISIGLLMRIADALDMQIEWLIAARDPRQADIGEIATLLASATKEQLTRVLTILAPEHPTEQRARRIALIGLRGAGKSTLGRLSAERLGVPFFELKAEIEQASGMAVEEVMALYGQEGYRHLEHDALERMAGKHDQIVLAVAGGIVSDPDIYDYLLGHYHTVWLKAAPEEHMARVREQGDERPMAGNPNAMEQLRTILTSREALYARAAASVNTSGQTLDGSLEQLLRVIDKNGFLSN